MQIGALSTGAQVILGNSNTGVDGSQKTATEIGNSGQPDDVTQASGNLSSSQAVQPPEESLGEVAVAQTEPALQTKVVTSADEVLGTGLGTNINTTA